MNFGFQRGTKLFRSSSVARHEKAVLTTQRSLPNHASSCPWISPVKCADFARKHASCWPAGSIRFAISGSSLKQPDGRAGPYRHVARAYRHPHGLLEVVVRQLQFTPPTPTATTFPAWYVETSSELPRCSRIRGQFRVYS